MNLHNIRCCHTGNTSRHFVCAGFKLYPLAYWIFYPVDMHFMSLFCNPLLYLNTVQPCVFFLNLEILFGTWLHLSLRVLLCISGLSCGLSDLTTVCASPLEPLMMIPMRNSCSNVVPVTVHRHIMYNFYRVCKAWCKLQIFFFFLHICLSNTVTERHQTTDGFDTWILISPSLLSTSMCAISHNCWWKDDIGGDCSAYGPVLD